MKARSNYLIKRARQSSSRLPYYLLLLSITGTAPGQPTLPVSDTPFEQDVHESHPLATPAENDVRSIAVEPSGRVWAATGAGVRYLDGSDWKKPSGGAEIGPVYTVHRDASGVIWAGAWNGLYRVTPEIVSKPVIANTLISAIGEYDDSKAGKVTLVAAGPHGIWHIDGSVATRIEARTQTSIRAVLPVGRDKIWVGTASGLFLLDLSRDPVLCTRYSEPSVVLSSNISSLKALPSGEVAVGSTGGVDFYSGSTRRTSLSVKDGLPNRYVTAIAIEPAGRLWIGTRLGVARYYDHGWSLRHSRRWLQSNDVRDVAIANDGSAWIATGAGVDRIYQIKLTLQQKSDRFLEIIRARHLRPPGLIGPAVLATPGDLSKSFIEDDDNDGEHTGMYLAMESFRYATTHEATAREEAKAAFHGLLALQRVTGTNHFIARSMLPVGTAPRHEVDATYAPQQVAEMGRIELREKIIEKRWVPSADGQWLWKRDASSDEVDGHIFGYAAYYDLAADEDEKRLVAEQVDRIVGGIVDHGYVLADIDGKATRWGNWSPESLNHDPNWYEERGGNSAEMLEFLGVAYHMTHKQRYVDSARYLIEQEGYARNMLLTKFNTPSERTRVEDELMTMVYHDLLTYPIFPSVREYGEQSLENWYGSSGKDSTPFFDFVYNRFSGKRTPLGQAVEILRDWPLDMIEWTVDNSQREDISIDKTPGVDQGNLTKPVARSEMGLCNWDSEATQLVIGRNGEREDRPNDWLLAYWMGRYYDLLDGPGR
jgi:Two component regulator propeller